MCGYSRRWTVRGRSRLAGGITTGNTALMTLIRRRRNWNQCAPLTTETRATPTASASQRPNNPWTPAKTARPTETETGRRLATFWSVSPEIRRCLEFRAPSSRQVDCRGSSGWSSASRVWLCLSKAAPSSWQYTSATQNRCVRSDQTLRKHGVKR